MVGSIVECIKNFAISQPEHLCLVDDSMDLSYGQYYSLIKKLASLLSDNRIKKNDKVVIEANQSIYFVALEHALHLLGAIFVPLEHKCSSNKMISVANVCNARLIVSNDICEDYSCITYKDIEEGLDRIDKLVEFEMPNHNDISEILFSTGTTGKEKGIVLAHSSSIAVAENIANAVDLDSNNIEMIPSPLNHSHGLRSYYANMLRGGTVIIISNVMDMKRFFKLMDEYKVNSLDLVPAALNIILRLSKNKIGDYRNQLKYIEFGSAAMTDGDRQKIKNLLPNVPLYNFYGSTESGRVTVCNFNTEIEKKGNIGKPTCNVTLKIIDDDGNHIVSSKEKTGLLATAGEMNMVGYYEDDDETKATMIDGFVYSKDEAYIDEDGDIILLGRKGDVINVGGKKVSPEEIENVVRMLDFVVDCGCISVSNDVLGQEPKLYVQIKRNIDFDSILIKNHIGEYLEGFKVPKIIEQIDTIPRSFNGKLLRKRLKDIDESK